MRKVFLALVAAVAFATYSASAVVPQVQVTEQSAQVGTSSQTAKQGHSVTVTPAGDVVALDMSPKFNVPRWVKWVAVWCIGFALVMGLMIGASRVNRGFDTSVEKQNRYN